MIIADLHIHSRFSRATSKDITVDNLEKYARIKGIDLLGTGDFTHPKWFSELKEKLSEKEGILKTKTGFNFILQTEVCLVYENKGKVRKVHFVVLTKDFETAEKINKELSKYSNLSYDGRPILKLSAPEFITIIKSIDYLNEIIPAHIWTPWFGIFGSKSGFDSVEECCEDKTKDIFALETGLSSDPEMNWRLSSLDRFTLVSNSDSHSFWPWRLGREANIFSFNNNELTYKQIIESIRTRENLKATIEVDPGYGKYHLDGHRNCNVYFSPEESKKYNNICPICGKPLTIGVLNRVESLADRPHGFIPKNAIPFKKMIPLSELISLSYSISMSSKKCFGIYYGLINKFKSEYEILLTAKKEDLLGVVKEELIDLILKNRDGKIKIKPGYDGVYGEPVLDINDVNKNSNSIDENADNINNVKKQSNKKLNDFF